MNSRQVSHALQIAGLEEPSASSFLRLSKDVFEAVIAGLVSYRRMIMMLPSAAKAHKIGFESSR